MTKLAHFPSAHAAVLAAVFALAAVGALSLCAQDPAEPRSRRNAVTAATLPEEVDRARESLKGLDPIPNDIPPETIAALAAKSLSYNLQDDTLGLWEATALDRDLAKTGPLGYTAAELASRGGIALQFPRESTARMPQPSEALVKKAVAFTAEESCPPEELANAARNARDKGKKFVAAPTGKQLLELDDEKAAHIAESADVFIIQAERWLTEDGTPGKDAFTGNVVKVAQVIRKANPACRIFVEVGRRTDRGGTAEEWMRALALLHAKDPKAFDGIYLFISRQEIDDAKQGMGALRQMLAWLRPPSTAPHTNIKAEHYEDMKNILRDGDIVYAFCVRDPDPAWKPQDENVPQRGPREFPKAVWNEDKFTKRIEALNAIRDTRVSKAVMFSSVEDLKANLKRLPKDLVWAGYDTEQGMTPPEELKDLEKALEEFSKVAREAKLKVMWGPTNVMISSNESKFLAMAKCVDQMGLQHQKVLESQGVDKFVELTKRRAEAIRRVNPSCEVGTQVVLGRGTNEQCVEALKGVSQFVSCVGVWTMNDPKGAAEIIRQARK